MAGITESNQGFGNFGIENTMELGIGDTTLLNDLVSPETSTTSPETVEKIDTKKKPPVSTTTTPTTTAAPISEKKEKSLEEKLAEGSDTEENENTDPDTENGSENRYSALAKDLLKLNIFTQDEGEEELTINTPEEFRDRFNYEKKKGAIETLDKFIGQFGDEYQDAFQAIYVKGVSPKEYFATFNTIENFAEMDLTQEENQKLVIRQALLDQGMDPEDIAAKIEKIKNYGDLEDESQRFHKVLVKKETAKLAQMQVDSETKLQQKLAARQKYAENVQNVLQEKLKVKEFDGIPLNPKLATELQDFLITEKWKTTSGETLTDFDRAILDLKRPENHERKVKLALLLKILEKDPTLSTIQKTGVTKKSNELFGEVMKHNNKVSGKSSGGGENNEKPVKWSL